MRKIRKNEIRQAAEILADCFYEYPLYDAFFGHTPKRMKQIFYFFWVRTYTRRDYTYVSDDMTMVRIFKMPGDKDRSMIGLFLNPVFLFGFIRNIPLSALKLVSEFDKMEQVYQAKYYDPDKDSMACAIGIRKDARGKGAMRKIWAEYRGDTPMFFETHTERNVEMYKHLGAELLDQTEWHGVTHYILKLQPAVEDDQ